MLDESAFQKLLSVMNRHIPAQRRALVELLREKDPHYLGKDGNRYDLDKEELRYLDSIVNVLDKGRLRLPILIMTDTEGEGGAWKVIGKVEARLVARVLGREMDTEDMVRFYHPHLLDLRRKLPTTTTVMYLP
jgi:uncharacterized protein (UPF0216 family)